ncbi:MAG: murein biosynthesis integral membrane protein MurJ [Chloroflexi bacterium]|nr:murein biosynthesis integral membrane protein MurJ [Chloroflexota bacterium]
MTADSPALDPADDEQERINARIAGAGGTLALGNVSSRIIGLAREMVITYFFGATSAVDALNVAIIVPRAIYDLLIGGHVNGAIVPVLSDVVARRGKDDLWRAVSALASLLVVALAALALLIEVFAPQIVPLVAADLDAETQALAAGLLRITAPSLLALSLFALFSGTLYALRAFTLPAFAGVVFNGCIVLLTLLLAPGLGIVAVALGWLVGSLVQMLLQLPGLSLRSLRPNLNWRQPALRRIGLLYIPVMLSLALDTLVVRIFTYNLASQTGAGSISIMNWATTLIQFPQGLVAAAISAAVLPTLAQQALGKARARAFVDTLGLGLRLTLVLILPASFGLFALASPIIALLFENGAFLAGHTLVTSTALRWYLLGLPFAALDLLLVYAFYARKDTLTPALVGIVSLALYIGAALLLFEPLGLYSLMLADSLKHALHASICAALLWRRLGGFGSQRLLATGGKALLASLVMALAAFISLPALQGWIGAETVLHEALLVALAGLVYGGIFWLAARWLRLEELAWLWSLLRQRLGRGER